MELRENQVLDQDETDQSFEYHKKYDQNKSGKNPYFSPEFSIVWTPLPIISAILPFIGHVGFVDINGNCFDFAGPYTVTVNDLAFGKPHKFHVLDKTKIKPGITKSNFLKISVIIIFRKSCI